MLKNNPVVEWEQLGTQQHPCLRKESEQEKIWGWIMKREPEQLGLEDIGRKYISWRRKEPTETSHSECKESNRITGVDLRMTEARWGPWLGGWVTFLARAESNNGRKGPKCPTMGTSWWSSDWKSTSQCRGCEVQSLVRDLRSYQILNSTTKILQLRHNAATPPPKAKNALRWRKGMTW